VNRLLRYLNGDTTVLALRWHFESKRLPERRLQSSEIVASSGSTALAHVFEDWEKGYCNEG
jgi:hypothetical protein